MSHARRSTRGLARGERAADLSRAMARLRPRTCAGPSRGRPGVTRASPAASKALNPDRDAKEDAMRSETRTVHIAAPSEAVYQYVSGLEHLPDWAV
jgi:uncharacterized membrane protein